MSGSERQVGGWVRFTRAWDWNVPGKGGRVTMHFREGLEILLTRAQHQSALEAGVIESIPNPRLIAAQGGDNGGSA